MDNDTFTKRYNFRLPDRTIGILDSVIGKGVTGNRTEALVWILDEYARNESKIANIEEDIEDLREKVTAHDSTILEFQEIINQLRNRKMLD